jgi:DNA-binding GntR family transcriptional regulator
MLKRDTNSLPQKTVVQGLVREIRERLLSGEIKGGDPLKQDQLAKQFGVSRIPVREALLQLDAEGLVRFFPHRGAVAAELSFEEANELFDLRVLLETAVLGKAIDRLTQQDLDRAAVAERRYAEAIERGTDIDSWGDLNWEFHRILYEPAEQPRTLAIIKNLHVSTARYQRLQLRLIGGVPRAEAEHRIILDACRRGKRGDAISALRSHILSVKTHAVRVLRKDD